MSNLCLTGLLLPGDFDTAGDCISLQLCTRDERVYSITDGTQNQDLEAYLRQTVRIFGELLIVDGKPQIMALSVKSQAD
jgi:hypothetical protein